MDTNTSSTKHLKNASIPFVPNMPCLNVPAMFKPILANYDAHVNNFIIFLRDRLQCRLMYQGFENVHHHILQKTIYACSVIYKPKKILKDVFPIMIGSRLDLAIRHEKRQLFEEPLNDPVTFPFQEIDIATGFFLINGFIRHVPYFYTNDPTNTHVIQKKMVRLYSYNAKDRGKELSYYLVDGGNKKSGDMVIVHNDGTETLDDPNFFIHCPYPVHYTAYMLYIYRQGLFDIDHLGNKMVISPGHLFSKLFIKYLYRPIQEQDWKLVKSRTSLIVNSIETGNLLHVLSRKTVYFKEGKSAGKMTNEPQESHREIGAKGEIYVEKAIGCYREVSTQTYPLNPYLLYMIVRQMSKKVKHTSLDSFPSSYVGYLCMLGCFETKNVGRTTMMVRDTIVTTCDHLDPVYHETHNADFWNALQLVPQSNSSYYVVVNEACIPVTKASFLQMELHRLKMLFREIECYERGKFIVIRFKMGLIMKPLLNTGIWVTPYDEMYWAKRLFGIDHKDQLISGFSSLTSYLTDLNPFFNHTAFPKDILAFNALKNAILATDSRYALYFMDTVSAFYKKPSPHHRILLKPCKDGISKYFVLQIPKVMVTYMSYMGFTQEDCIAKRENFRSFDSFRFYTIRFKIQGITSWITFYAVHGDVDEESDLLGTLISGNEIIVDPYSIHVRIKKMSSCEYRIHFTKYPFRVLQHYIMGDKLTICVEQAHQCNTGDKLCSLHGQKGVIRTMKHPPTLNETIQPDLIINPYCSFRMTPGQFIEAICFGNGQDASIVRNSNGKILPGSVFFGETFYFLVSYWANEHLYAPIKCSSDRVSSQPVKGRSRGGGMKLGNMEMFGIKGNGSACCFEQKFFEDSDRIQQNGSTVALPKSVNLVKEDAAFFKCLLDYQTSSSIQLLEE